MIGVDINEKNVNVINEGKVPFVEPDMATTVAGVVSQGFLKASTKTPHADNYIVAVPTPFTDGHEPDLSYIETAGKQIAPLLEATKSSSSSRLPLLVPQSSSLRLFSVLALISRSSRGPLRPSTSHTALSACFRVAS